tara:strand:- start:3542 stop:3799 length:258 start_codon:yes stop_codon:yes gene_type:complete
MLRIEVDELGIGLYTGGPIPLHIDDHPFSKNDRTYYSITKRPKSKDESDFWYEDESDFISLRDWLEAFPEIPIKLSTASAREDFQ